MKPRRCLLILLLTLATACRPTTQPGAGFVSEQKSTAISETPTAEASAVTPHDSIPVILPPSTAPTTAPAGADPRNALPYLASDELEGRGVGTHGLDLAADYIAATFAAEGLRPLPALDGYFQPFVMTLNTTIGSDTTLSVGSNQFAVNKDFVPIPISAEGSFNAPVVFVGYGISNKNRRYDDYAGVDVKGKIALAMRFEPHASDGSSRFAGKDDWSADATLSNKAAAAAEHGAVAMMLVNPPRYHAPDTLVLFVQDFGGNGHAKIPVIHVRQPVAESILARAGITGLAPLQDAIDQSAHPASQALAGVHVAGAVQFKRTTATVKNVVGMWPGEGPLAGEYVVVGAHYDHLGKGRRPTGSLAPIPSTTAASSQPSQDIYHGADDNASGTSAVLELASRVSAGGPRARSIVLVTFTGEEEGLIGSEYFVDHPPVPIDRMVGMINMDMVGRLRGQTLYIGGTGTAANFQTILDAACKPGPLQYKSIGKGGYGPSDHMAFALKKVPVLFFFTGLHPDYHRPSDTIDKVDINGIDAVVTIAQRVVDAMCTMPRQRYVATADSAGMKIPGREGGDRRASLGVIPNYTSADVTGGVLIDGVTPGSPAAAAGLAGGDVISAVGEQKIQTLQDLSDVLARAKPGDKVTITYFRAKEARKTQATLAERK